MIWRPSAPESQRPREIEEFTGLLGNWRAGEPDELLKRSAHGHQEMDRALP